MRRLLAAVVTLAACAVAGAASAAERGPRAAEAPWDAACGPGFTAVPGTRTCVRVGGRVRAEAEIGRGAVRPGAHGRVTLDARHGTEFGPVRTFLQVGAGR